MGYLTIDVRDNIFIFIESCLTQTKLKIETAYKIGFVAFFVVLRENQPLHIV